MHSVPFFPSHLSFTKWPILYSGRSIFQCRVDVLCVNFHLLYFLFSSKRDFEPKLAIFKVFVDLDPEFFTKFVTALPLTQIKLESDVFTLTPDFQLSYEPSVPLLPLTFPSITIGANFAESCVPQRLLHQQLKLFPFDWQVLDATQLAAFSLLTIAPFFSFLFTYFNRLYMERSSHSRSAESKHGNANWNSRYFLPKKKLWFQENHWLITIIHTLSKFGTTYLWNSTVKPMVRWKNYQHNT